jgi:NADPH-dependent 2,4-dienoyl-CoA reductase/sulfur reductase-like enzyme
VKDGKIYVTANLKTIMSKMGRSPIARAKAKKNRPAVTDEPKSSISPPDHETKDEKVVVVGGGSAGLHTVEALREHGFDGSITLISKEKYPPFDRTKLSKALITDAAKLAWRSEGELKNDFKVDLQLGTEVVKVDTQGKTVETNKGDKISYDKLVLAPGSQTKKLPIDGVDLEGIYTLRGLEDTQAIVAGKFRSAGDTCQHQAHEYTSHSIGINENTRVAIIGTSFIGMELAGSIMKKGPKSVDVIGTDPVPFEKILGADIGKAIQKVRLICAIS